MAEVSGGLSKVHCTCPGDIWRKKYFFSNHLRHPFLGNWAKKFVIFLPNIFRKVCQKCRVPFQTSTFKEVIFSRKLSFLLICLHFERENSGRVVKKGTTLTEEQLRKVVFQFEWFDSWYCFVTLNKIFTISAGKIQQGCQYCNFRVEKKQHPEKHLFFRINYQFHFILGFWGLLVWTFSEKLIRTFRAAFNVSGGKNRLKKFFLD